MGIRLFDRKFGKDFLAGLPHSPGVYEFRDPEGRTIYVGKAKSLRRRIGQYRNARRLKRHLKMKRILRDAVSVTLHVCASETDALLLENRLIRELRPRFNLAGAFAFMYPSLALKMDGNVLVAVYTTQPEAWEAHGYRLFGSFRSREATREAYGALVSLLSRAGHREPPRRVRELPRVRYSIAAAFRGIPPEAALAAADFLRSGSRTFLDWIFGAMLEHAGARRDAAEVQEELRALGRFARSEIRRLAQVRERTGFQGEFVPQEERDRLFILFGSKDLTR